MKIYLVGGAVRDRLLGYPTKERDWVVVGAKPDDLLQQGYQQVGRDFPVFLHPHTKEEYALARKERKQGSGYYGFECDFDPGVRLEDDLLRRDLTMNAMAMDEDGHMIDPFGGEADLKNRIVRHVSPAFIEDPVRVLRVARFMARYHHLGFKLAHETRLLMYDMVERGEVGHLIPERVWQEWQKSLLEKNPELFLYTLRSCGALRVILPEIDGLFGVPSREDYHREVDTGVHMMMVLCAATKLSDDPVVRFAAALHDLGKRETPIESWPAHHGHEALGLAVIERLCQRLRIPKSYSQFAQTVSKYHGEIHRLTKLRAGTIVKILEQTDAFRRPALFEKLLIACEADADGHGLSGSFPHIPWVFPSGAADKTKTYPTSQIWRAILTECSKITAQAMMTAGYTGPAISVHLHQQRVSCVKMMRGQFMRDLSI